MSDSNVLKPGQQIKPKIDEKKAIILVEKLYGLRVKEIRELNAYDDKNYHVHCEDHHENPHIRYVNEHGYVLKILNSLDSRNTGFVDGQNEMMIYLDRRDVTCPVPVKNLRGAFNAVEKFDSGSSEEHVVRLLVYRPGTLLHAVPISAELLQDVGRFVARLDATLGGFFHPAYENRSTLWMLAETPRLRDFAFAISDENDRKMILSIVDVFEKEVLTVADQLEAGIVHGDLNEQNILVNSDGTRVTAVIDFGDTHRACLIFELAIAVCYMIIQARDLKMGRPVIDGFQSVKKLRDLEKKLLKICVCARLSQSLVLGAYSHLSDPHNDYLLITQKPGLDVLRKLWPLEDDKVLKIWGLADT